MLLDILNEKFREPAECVIEVDGAAITDIYPYIDEITVDSSRSAGSQATLKFNTRRDENGKWAVQDSGLLMTWSRIVIKASFGSRSDEVMRGYIKNINADYGEEQCSASVTVICQDDLILLDRKHRRETWGEPESPKTDFAIFKKMLTDSGLDAHDKYGKGQKGVILNQDSTDIVFLKKRAELNGYELIAQEGKVYFGEPRLEEEAQPTIMVYAGPQSNCIRFAVNADGHKPDKVIYDIAIDKGTDTEEVKVEPKLFKQGSTRANQASKKLSDYVLRLSRQGGCEGTGLAALAQAKANELDFKLQANGELDGTLYGAVLQVAQPVRVDGAGEQLDGIYYVDSVLHRFTQESYRQEFKLLRNAYGESET